MHASNTLCQQLDAALGQGTSLLADDTELTRESSDLSNTHISRNRTTMPCWHKHAYDPQHDPQTLDVPVHFSMHPAC